jgi:two-component system osmolarity sensor histidine kinase EnvZ
LIASTLLVFSIIAWQAIIWTAIVPAAELTAHILTQKAGAAISARRDGTPLPEGARFESGEPPAKPRFGRGAAVGVYVETVRRNLQAALGSPEVRINRLAAPSEVWVRLPDDGVWLVLTWRLAGPRAPLAALGLLATAALIVLAAAAFLARRLTAPLAGLAAAAARVAEGEKVEIETATGPSEVRSLAVAFQSMSHRLAELDEQRELMLGGISHDLRTPLARMRVAIELLDAKNAALLEEMAASIAEMDRMIGQFLHYARANYRESPASAVPDDIVRESLAMYSTDARLALALSASAPRLLAVECLRHTVRNLVQNALEYGRAPVTVRTTMAPGEVRLVVEDCGAGLTDAQWSEAVRPFHRLGAPATDGHSGLGLALVVRLVTKSGGAISSLRANGVYAVTVRLPAKA